MARRLILLTALSCVASTLLPELHAQTARHVPVRHPLVRAAPVRPVPAMSAPLRSVPVRPVPVRSDVIRPAPVALGPTFQHLTVSSVVMSRADDNVNRDTIGTLSVGVIGGIAARFTSGANRPWLVLEYDAAIHRYSATDRFNRVSQRARSTLSTRLSHRWGIDLVTEGARGGSSEDRDVSDQLSVLPRLEYRIDGARRVRVSVSQRWRQFPTDSLQNAVNRYAAAEFRHRLSDGAAFEAEVRVERNEARGARFDFSRPTISTVYSTPLSARATLEAGMQFRMQRYPSRAVEIRDKDVPRVDLRLQPTLALQMRVAGSDLEISYEPEWRQSNDPTKSLLQNVLMLGVRRRWY
jgi:hypothetical protein